MKLTKINKDSDRQIQSTRERDGEERERGEKRGRERWIKIGRQKYGETRECER